jgi:hypothetical protein
MTDKKNRQGNTAVQGWKFDLQRFAGDDGDKDTDKDPKDTGPKDPEKKDRTYTQEDFDRLMAKTRRATEAETKKQFLAALGLKPEDEAKLEGIKKAYDATLSDAEKANEELALAKKEASELKGLLEEKEYIIMALQETTGKKAADVEKVVRMAKGLKDDSTPIEQAIKQVIEYAGKTAADDKGGKPPKSRPPHLPDDKDLPEKNPFKGGEINLTEQGRLWRTDREKAVRLAQAAGIDVKAIQNLG